MQTQAYQSLFNIKIAGDTRAKDFFMTNHGGAVAAFGSSGAITGRDAGLPGLNRYTGAVICDDLLKPDEAHSETMRERVRRNFFETIVPRCRGINVPIVVIGQRLHEDDICATLINDYADEWRLIEIEALDRAGHSRYPEQISTEQLKRMKEKQPYVFWSQYQQKPIPSGGALYKTDDFIMLDQLPAIYATFVTADTAETEKTWNDKTVFSFWGLYRPVYNGVASEQVCLHWLDCWELSIEPADLEVTFLDFWASCMHFKIKPTTALIEKKSTGVTLVSILKRTPGIRVIGIERNKASGSKTQRFIDLQYYIASRLVTLPEYGKHTKMCIEHMLKITANDAHRFDDIADTCYDAVKAALIDKIIVHSEQNSVEYNQIAARMVGFTKQVDELRRKAHGSSPSSPGPIRTY
jgi:predicted phage terminase large subunit-like protein